MKIFISTSVAITLPVIQKEIAKKNKHDAARKQVQSLTNQMKGQDKTKRESTRLKIKAIKDGMAAIEASRVTKLSLGQLVAKRDALRKK